MQGQPAWPGEETDEQAHQAYQAWKMQREKEMEEARNAAAMPRARDEEERWGAVEARKGKVRLWLPETAMKITQTGEFRLRDPRTSFGRVSLDWAGVLGKPTAEQMAECTKDLGDEGHRIQAICWDAACAQAAYRWECVTAIVGEDRKRMQQILGKTAFTQMTPEDYDTLDSCIKEWARGRGKKWYAEAEMNMRSSSDRQVAYAEDAERRIDKLSEMLMRLGVPQQAIQNQMAELEQEQQARRAPDVPMVEVKDEDDDDLDSLEQTMHNSQGDDTNGATMQWAPPEDTYLDGRRKAEDDDDVSMEDSQIRPMTHEEIAAAWNGPSDTRAGRFPMQNETWVKGRGKEHDRPSMWSGLTDAETQRPKETRGDKDGAREEDTRKRRPGVGLQKGQGTVAAARPRYETRRRAQEQSAAKKKDAKVHAPTPPTRPPRGGPA